MPAQIIHWPPEDAIRNAYDALRMEMEGCYFQPDGAEPGMYKLGCPDYGMMARQGLGAGTKDWLWAFRHRVLWYDVDMMLFAGLWMGSDMLGVVSNPGGPGLYLVRGLDTVPLGPYLPNIKYEITQTHTGSVSVARVVELGTGVVTGGSIDSAMIAPTPQPAIFIQGRNIGGPKRFAAMSLLYAHFHEPG